ncbi:MAG: DNRLRE domain-containing protein [Gorillibacterium sp.]|nr:DNRLRE domain-containing protein [Gorillibacterium sp.]
MLFKNKKIRIYLCTVILMLFTFEGFSFQWVEKGEAASTSFRFVVMGDSRGASDGINESALRGLMSQVKGLSKQPAFLLFTGDQVMGGSDVETELYEWKDIVDDYYPMNKIYPALGNHEHDETIFSNVFNYLPNEQLKGYKRTAYYFDYGNARFITLNTERKNSDGRYVSPTQLEWLETILKTSGKTHHFVQFHYPAYPIGAHYGNSLDRSPESRDALWGILDKYKVTTVLVGHEHNYNRRTIDASFNGNGYQFNNSIDQVTLGGGGAPLTTLNKDPRNVVAGPVGKFHYLVVDVADNTASFKVYDSNNNPMDSFSVTQSEDTSETMQFQTGSKPSSNYDGAIDTTISQNSPAARYGSLKMLFVDGDDPNGSKQDKNVLLKWNLSASPSDKKATSASIKINVANPSNNLYYLYALKRNWYESTASWEKFSKSYKWTEAGGTSLKDKDDKVMGKILATTTGVYTFSLNADGLAAIQNWIDNPASNYGFIVTNSTSIDGLDFHSSEADTISQRPELTVTFE